MSYVHWSSAPREPLRLETSDPSLEGSLGERRRSTSTVVASRGQEIKGPLRGTSPVAGGQGLATSATRGPRSSAGRPSVGDALHDTIKGSGGKLVARPDSGDPASVVVKCLQIMERKIGMRTNTKGYKVLPPYLGLIQGDGINDESIGEILHALRARQYSASNLAFGMGGGLLQQLDRDTQKFAFKCAAALRGGEWIDVSKDPATDTGKRSKRGHLALVTEGGKHATVRGPRKDDLLQTVYESGVVTRTYTLDEVRAQAMRGIR